MSPTSDGPGDAGPAPAAPSGTNNPEIKYEKRDADTRVILKTAGILIVSAVVIHVVVWGIFELMRSMPPREPAPPLAVEDSQRPVIERLRTISGPRLEGLEPHAVDKTNVLSGPIVSEFGWNQRPEDMQAWKQPRLKDYGSTDPRSYGPTETREAGFVHIPIDLAMRKLLENHELPSANGVDPMQEGLEMPSETNSGHGPVRPHE